MGLARVGISVTTLDPALSRRMEPRVPLPGPPARDDPAPDRRGRARCGSWPRPMIPALTDHELEAILAAGREAGAVAASWIMLRLPREVAPLFREWLGDALSRPRRARHGAGAGAARRAGLRRRVGQAHDGGGGLRRPHAPPLRRRRCGGSASRRSCRRSGRTSSACRRKPGTSSSSSEAPLRFILPRRRTEPR